MRQYTFLTLQFLFFPFQIFSQAISLDSSYNNIGYKTIKVVNQFHDDYGHDIILQPDEKVVVLGYSSNGGSSISLSRINTDGSLDTSFGINGTAIYSYSMYNDNGTSLALQTNGKIVVTGNHNSSVLTFRVNNNGSLDSTFGINGFIETDINQGIDLGQSVKIQPDGKIVVGGYTLDTSPATNSDTLILVRYTSTGLLDSTFGINGIVNNSFNGMHPTCNAITLLPDGRIIAAGSRVHSIKRIIYNTINSKCRIQ